ncbi:MAG TPA: nucleotidyltransferase [Thermoanaerobaculia bacterium]|nr:nucleotidyltransferase [Thermoanaerobaculia bacterium]
MAGPGLEEEFLAHRRFVDLGGLEVPVISPEDLVVTKILAGRPKDLEDVRGVLREQSGRLDLQRSRRFLRMLEQALDRSDLLPVLDRLLEE